MKKTIATLFLTLSMEPVSANSDGSVNLKKVWETISSQGEELLAESLGSLSSFLESIEDVVNKELLEIEKNKIESNQVDVRNKINSIRNFVAEISELKKEEANASSFTLISKSKKDYRLQIDKVLEEVEPILFDGQIVDYSSRIRSARENIKRLINEKVQLNEQLIFSSNEPSLFASSESELRGEISNIEELIEKYKSLITELELDLQRKMAALGIELSIDQIKVMTTRIDGDELARSFAIFDITKQISNTLAKLVEENSFSGSNTVKYYGVYVILSEILAFSQKNYIYKLENVYLPALDQIGENVDETIAFSKQSLDNASSETNKAIFNKNIESNAFTLFVIDEYRKILLNQVISINGSMERTKEQITVAYSTYDTAVNSANLVNLINETQNSFSQIMNMQLPEIIPFKNEELQLKFQQISDQLNTSVLE